MTDVAAPFLRGVGLVPERLPEDETFPWTLPFLRALDLSFDAPVTMFVGENGSGKSTLLEAIAVLARLPVAGGSRNELGHEEETPLANALRPRWKKPPPDGYFLRAELLANFASMLDARAADPDFTRSPYARYGGRSLHTRSHGEAFLDLMVHRFTGGLYLLDEPEAALSPSRQLALLALVHELVENGLSQFVIATHSPILMTFPGAALVSFDDPKLPRIRLEDTSHYRLTREILAAPERYWKHLRQA